MALKFRLVKYLTVFSIGFGFSGALYAQSVLLWVDNQTRRQIANCGFDYTVDRDSMADFSPKEDDAFSGRVKLLADPHQAFFAKLFAIQQARYSIDISVYILKLDETTRSILWALRKAAEMRGVNVRLMIDAGGSLSLINHHDLKSLLHFTPGINPYTQKQATVDLILFRPLMSARNFINWGIARATNRKEFTTIMPNRRSHDKILLVDRDQPERSIAILGGRNLSNSYYGYPQVDGETYEDTEVMVRDDFSKAGPMHLSNTVGEHYRRLLCHKGNEWMSITGTFDRSMKNLDAFTTIIKNPTFRQLYVQNYDHGTYPILNNDLLPAQVRFFNERQNIRRSSWELFKDPAVDVEAVVSNGDSIIVQARALIHKAQNTIDIVSPYLFLTNAERDWLLHWAQEKPGRRLRIISNSVATSDNMMAQTLVDREVGPYMQNHPGVEIYSLGRLDGELFGGKAFYGKLHSKYMIVDGQYSFVSSHNADPRSRLLNSEVAFRVDSAQMGQQLEAEFQKALNRSYLWGSPEWQELVGRKELRKKRWMMDSFEFMFKRPRR